MSWLMSKILVGKYFNCIHFNVATHINEESIENHSSEGQVKQQLHDLAEAKDTDNKIGETSSSIRATEEPLESELWDLRAQALKSLACKRAAKAKKELKVFCIFEFLFSDFLWKVNVTAMSGAFCTSPEAYSEPSQTSDRDFLQK